MSHNASDGEIPQIEALFHRAAVEFPALSLAANCEGDGYSSRGWERGALVRSGHAYYYGHIFPAVFRVPVRIELEQELRVVSTEICV